MQYTALDGAARSEPAVLFLYVTMVIFLVIFIQVRVHSQKKRTVIKVRVVVYSYRLEWTVRCSVNMA